MMIYVLLILPIILLFIGIVIAVSFIAKEQRKNTQPTKYNNSKHSFRSWRYVIVAFLFGMMIFNAVIIGFASNIILFFILILPIIILIAGIIIAIRFAFGKNPHIVQQMSFHESPLIIASRRWNFTIASAFLLTTLIMLMMVNFTSSTTQINLRPIGLPSPYTPTPVKTDIGIAITVGAEHYVVTVGDISGYIHLPIVGNRLILQDGIPVASRETIALLLGITQRSTAQEVIFTNDDGQEYIMPLDSLFLEEVALFAGAHSIVWNETNQTVFFSIYRVLTANEISRINRRPFLNEDREKLTLAQLLEQSSMAMPHIDNWNRGETPFAMLPDRRLQPHELAIWRMLHAEWGITEREVAFVHRINAERVLLNVEGLIICPYLSQLARFNIQSQLDIGIANIASSHPRYGETVSVEFGSIFGITTIDGRFSLGAITFEPNANSMRNLELSDRAVYNTLIASHLRYIGIGSVNNITYIIIADASHDQNYSYITIADVSHDQNYS